MAMCFNLCCPGIFLHRSPSQWPSHHGTEVLDRLKNDPGHLTLSMGFLIFTWLVIVARRNATGFFCFAHLKACDIIHQPSFILAVTVFPIYSFQPLCLSLFFIFSGTFLSESPRWLWCCESPWRSAVCQVLKLCLLYSDADGFEGQQVICVMFKKRSVDALSSCYVICWLAICANKQLNTVPNKVTSSIAVGMTSWK